MALLITTRDLEVIRHLENGMLLTADIASRLVYHTQNKTSSLKIAQRRLTELYKSKHIKRLRNSVTNSYIYYLNKTPTKVDHRLTIASFIAELNIIGFEIEEYQLEYTVLQENYHLRPDIFLILNNHGKRISALVEVDLTKGFTNIDKYNNVITDTKNGIKTGLPALSFMLVAVTDKQINKDECLIKPIQIHTDFSDINRIMYPFQK